MCDVAQCFSSSALQMHTCTHRTYINALVMVQTVSLSDKNGMSGCDLICWKSVMHVDCVKGEVSTAQIRDARTVAPTELSQESQKCSP